jgi:hypothetical protein
MHQLHRVAASSASCWCAIGVHASSTAARLVAAQAVFRSVNRMLLDTATSEFFFCCDWFEDPAAFQELFRPVLDMVEADQAASVNVRSPCSALCNCLWRIESLSSKHVCKALGVLRCMHLSHLNSPAQPWPYAKVAQHVPFFLVAKPQKVQDTTDCFMTLRT